ncbi:MAG: ATP-binding protein [Ekhidna sp.]
MSKKYVCLILLSQLLFGFLEAQNIKIDSLRKALQDSDKDKSIEIHKELGSAFYPDSPDSMLWYYQKVIDAPEASVAQKGNAHIGCGTAYYVMGNYDDASESNLLGLRLYQSINDKYGMARSYNALGLNFSVLDDREKASRYHRKSAAIAEAINDSLLLGKTYMNLSINNFNIEPKDSALYYAEKAILMFSAVDNEINLAMSYNRMALSLFAVENYAKAIEWNLRVLEEFPNLSKWEEGFTYLILARNYNGLGDLDKSISFGLKAYATTQPLGAAWDLQQITQILAEGYEKQGKFGKALRYQKEYKAYSDSLFNKESETRINSLLLKQQELENAQLAQENKLKEEELIVKNQQLFIVLGGAFGLCVFLFYVFRNSRKRRALYDELLAAHETKDKFFSIIAHDLRSPFNSLLGFLTILHDNVGSWPKEEVQKFSKQLLESSRNVDKLLENLLEWSRLQAGALEINRQPIFVKEAVEENKKLLEQTAIDKGIKIQVIPLKELNEHTLKVQADRNMLSTILRNLISNAIKFSSEGDKIMISIQAYSNKEFLQFNVSDEGTGIKPDVLSNLFDINKKTSQLGTQQEKGTGLGLTLCKEFVEEHGGKIWVEKTSKEGTTFSFTMPLA